MLRFLVRLFFPRSFVAAYGRELIGVFHDRVNDVRRSSGRVRSWLTGGRLIADMAFSGTRVRFRQLLSIRHTTSKAGRFEEGYSMIFLNIKQAFRALRRAPGFAAVTVVTLALGIGSNTAVFSIVNSVLLSSPFDARLVAITQENSALGVRGAGVSGSAFMEWRERASSFDEMAAYQPGSGTATGLERPEQIPGMRVTANFISILGGGVSLGRSFVPEDGAGGRHNVMLITDGFFRSRLGGRQDAIGETLMGDGLEYTLTGVLQPDFWFPVEAWVFVPWPEPELRERAPTERDLGVIARLAPGVTIDQARSEMREISRVLAGEMEAQRNWGVEIEPLNDLGRDAVRPALLVLLAAVSLVLLIACGNVANLFMARGAARHREIAIRLATGASRRQVVAQEMWQSGLLGAAAGALGLGVVVLLLDGLTRWLPTAVQTAEGSVAALLPQVVIDGRVLAFTVVISMATVFLSGLAPALQTTAVNVGDALKNANRGGASSRGGRRVRQTLVAGQLSLAMVLLVGTGLMIATLWRLRSTDAGFDRGSLLTMKTELPTDTKYQEATERALFYQQVLAQLNAIPGVQHAGVSEILPLDGQVRRLPFRFERDPETDTSNERTSDYNLVSAGFFETLGIPLLRGRHFGDLDAIGQPRVIMVDRTFVDRYMDGRDPIGERVDFGNTYEIVGVVGAIRSETLEGQPRPTVYFHYLQIPDDLMSFVVRGRGDALSLVDAARNAVAEVDADQPVYDVQTMEQIVADRAATQGLLLRLLGVFGGLAILIAAIGVYSVMSHLVRQRTQELGLRQALGASPGRVLGEVLRESLIVAAGGMAIGFAVLQVASGAISSLLYGVEPNDFRIVAAVAVLLGLVAVAATWVPARTASKVDPMDALRTD